MILMVITITAGLGNIKNTAAKNHYNYFTASCVIHLSQKTDTEKYLRDNIIAQKAKFIHKELNVMLAGLNLPVKSYSLGSGGRIPAAPFKYLELNFEDFQTTVNKWHKSQSTPMLCVYFEDDIPYKVAMALYVKSFGDWKQAEEDYYGKLIIKNIEFIDPAKKPISHPKSDGITKDGKVTRM